MEYKIRFGIHKARQKNGLYQLPFYSNQHCTSDIHSQISSSQTYICHIIVLQVRTSLIFCSSQFTWRILIDSNKPNKNHRTYLREDIINIGNVSNIQFVWMNVSQLTQFCSSNVHPTDPSFYVFFEGFHSLIASHFLQ